MSMMSKPHYIMLDGLRGVAALMVVLYHLFEAVAFADGAPEQQMFHGFLAVDFFFVLSGFVMGYAYDDKWNEMTIAGFFRRRLIRLHPMVVAGVLFGLLAFIFQGCYNWNYEVVPLYQIVLATVFALFLLPVPYNLDIRGNTEMFPINGPHWSLFFEYIGNIFYALYMRKFSDRALKIWIAVFAVILCWYGFLGPDKCGVAYGWSSNPLNALGGVSRMFFAYPMGLLLSRYFKRKQSVQYGDWMFPICALVLCALLSVPSMTQINADIKVFYELFCIIIAFPLIVWFAAHGVANCKGHIGLIKYLGNLSYPLYAIHYPLIYLYIHWINKGIKPFGDGAWITPVVLAVIAIILGSIAYYLYDMPIRRYLNKKYN